MNKLNWFNKKLIPKEIWEIYSEKTTKKINDFSQNINDIVLWNPRYLLYLLADIQNKLNQNTITLDWFSEWTFWWNFSWYKTLIIEDWKVVLIRIADSYEHLIKSWLKSSGTQDLYDTSIYHWWWNWVPTSAFNDWDKQFWTTKKVVWTFKIPILELIKIFENGKAILWNIWEWEVVLSPDIAQRYLDNYEVRENSNWYNWLPDEINITF